MGNGMLSQEEIDALLRGTLEPDVPFDEPLIELFSAMEKDAIGEIANISMGTAATTLSQLLSKKVEITTPKVDVCDSQQIRQDYPNPSVIVDVKYKAGIEGSNLLILSQRDGAVIVDLMMGGDGTNPSTVLTELQISGISEAMNQMMGSAATSMSTIFKSIVDISPPQLVLNDPSIDGESENFLDVNETYVRISFRMVVETVIDSILVQVIPLSVARGMVTKLLGGVDTAVNSTPSDPALMQQSELTYSPQTYPPQEYPPQGYPPQAYPPQAYPPQTYPPQAYPPPEYTSQGYPPQGYPPSPYGTPPYGANVPPQQQQGGYYNPPQNYAPPTTPVQPAQFAPLQAGPHMTQPDNLGLILDVPLQVSVELGKARKTIKEILEMGPGSVIELDRLAGEPVDMIVNGKLIAKCEVVVINETFGIRITDIIHPMERMKTLN